jgi:hypothetical protein
MSLHEADQHSFPTTKSCLFSVRSSIASDNGQQKRESLEHKVRTYQEYHSVCPSSELGLPPTPHPQASVPPPPCFWGEGNNRWRERGWESPNSDEGRTMWYSLYVRTLWFRKSDLCCCWNWLVPPPPPSLSHHRQDPTK